MRINFFEEFPTKENLEKARMIDFPSAVFIAAHSLQEFYKLEKELRGINPRVETAYWPILPNTYWISPFSYTEDLENLIKDLKTVEKPLTVLIDLELPLLNRIKLYFTNLFSLAKNKKIIKEFFKSAPDFGIKILTAEYPTAKISVLRFFEKIGIWYDPKKYPHDCCVMYYTSMISGKKIHNVRKNILKIKKEINPDLELGLGTIAIGIQGNEPILLPEKLEEDLKFAKENGFKKITIFRLGGLNQDYYEVLKKYAD